VLFRSRAGALLAVDNTFASPVLQVPITLGADYVVHSTTKYIGGHSDVTGGAVVVRDIDLMKRIRFLQTSMGAVPGAFDCFLQHRGLKTLALRMERHCENASKLALHLQSHPKLERVNYPFLPDHPDHEVATRQMCGGGGVVTIVFKGASRDAGISSRDEPNSGSDIGSDDSAKTAALRFCEHLRLFSLAESLGGVESLVSHVAIMTFTSVPREILEARGVTDALVRLSVGIEDINDLISDVDQALDQA